jgi:hypothetical protein
MTETETLKTSRGHDHARILAVRIIDLRKPRIDIPAQIRKPQMREQTAELR